jgi:hypothetical protein
MDRPDSADPGRLSWDFAALQGLGSEGPERVWVSARPVRRFYALRVIVLRTVRPTEVSRWPSLRFRAPSETCLLSPASRPRSHRPKPAFEPSRNASSPGLSCPTTHAGPAFCFWQRVPPPPRAAYEVWLPPSRRSLPILPTPKRRSVHGLCPPRLSPRTREVPLSGSLPS